MTYAEAQMRIDDVKQQDAVTKGLRRLNMLAKKLKNRRIENGFVHGWTDLSPYTSYIHLLYSK